VAVRSSKEVITTLLVAKNSPFVARTALRRIRRRKEYKACETINTKYLPGLKPVEILDLGSERIPSCEIPLESGIEGVIREFGFFLGDLQFKEIY